MGQTVQFRTINHHRQRPFILDNGIYIQQSDAVDLQTSTNQNWVQTR